MTRMFTWGLPLFFTLAGAAVGGALILSGESEPAHAEAVERLPTVHVDSLVQGSQPVSFSATGAVEAAHELAMVSEVSGRVSWVRDNLRAGTTIVAGESLARIDDTAYRASISEARARIARAQASLAVENGRKEVAGIEASMAGIELGANKSLVLRGPQLASAKAELSAANHNLASVQRNHANTWFRAPFDALVVQETLEPGRVVNPGSQVARLVGTDAMHIRVGVPTDTLDHLDLSGTASVRVGTAEPRTGRILGLTGEADSTTRTATVLIEVEKPFEGEHPLLPGSFATVELQGEPITNAWTVPVTAIVDGRSVWTVVDDKLQRQDIRVVWRQGDRVVVRGELTGALVTRPPSVPLHGMSVLVSREVM